MLPSIFILTLHAIQNTGQTGTNVISTLKIVKEVVIIVAATVGVLVAVLGLWTWKKQLKGNTEYELARRLLRSVYKTRDAIQSVRNIFISSSEIANAIDEAKHIKDEDKQKLTTGEKNALVYELRWKAITEALSDLKVEALEAEVLWSPSITDKLKPLYKCVSKLNVSIMEYLRESNVERKIHNIVFKISDDPSEDKFTSEINEAVSNIEITVKPFLKL